MDSIVNYSYDITPVRLEKKKNGNQIEYWNSFSLVVRNPDLKLLNKFIKIFDINFLIDFDVNSHGRGHGFKRYRVEETSLIDLTYGTINLLNEDPNRFIKMEDKTDAIIKLDLSKQRMEPMFRFAYSANNLMVFSAEADKIHIFHAWLARGPINLSVFLKRTEDCEKDAHDICEENIERLKTYIEGKILDTTPNSIRFLKT